jgi:acetyl-CoA synthetase
MLSKATRYDDLCRNFAWAVPERYNIGVDVCDRWAAMEPERTAIVEVTDSGQSRPVSYGELRNASNRLASALSGRGIARGDRIGILLPQMVETAVAHIAAYKLGAIAIPLFTLFGEEALLHRLRDAGAAAVITNAEGAARLSPLREALPALRLVVATEAGVPGTTALPALLAEGCDGFTPADTMADDPALIIYTSGTTGMPKGALHAHRVLLGHLPGVEMSHDLFPEDGDRIWTPADWAWIGGLLDVLMPALHHGVPVVARRFAKFTGEAAFDLMATQKVRNAFIPPTALKMMRAASTPADRARLDLRTVASGGETLGEELLDWGRNVLGVTINEFYGQTECNMVVSSCQRLFPAAPGRMGRAVPGHVVDVIDDEGRPCPDGIQGAIGVRREDPVMFLGYWNNPAATAAKFRGDWLLTGDTGMREAGGLLRFVGRDDDVITSAGYRIGPGEIEDCLLRHPAVRMAGVVGKPDPRRTEIVKAYVVLREGFEPSDALVCALQAHVRSRLAAHEYPREVAFVDDLPLTTTGKIIRRDLRARAIAESTASFEGDKT